MNDVIGPVKRPASRLRGAELRGRKHTNSELPDRKFRRQACYRPIPPHWIADFSQRALAGFRSCPQTSAARGRAVGGYGRALRPAGQNRSTGSSNDAVGFAPWKGQGAVL